MKHKYFPLLLLVGVGALVVMLYSHFREELVVESAPVCQLSYDEQFTSVDYETATFGLG